MPLNSGTRIGVYQVTAKIGEGGMGEVYQARDTKLDRDVALKVLPEAFTADPDRLARFEREAKVLASLNHPNIGSIYGLEEDGDTKALVLELVEGPTLADRITQGPIPVGEALPIAKQIAEALEAAHEQGVIHRDLKPANIKVREDGTVKVLDFGLAKAFQPDAGDPSLSQSPTISLTAAATQMGMVIGTAAYMSPEQAKGKIVDKRSDIWAFGAVFFEMLSGHPAFPGDDVTEVLAAVVRAEPDWHHLPADVNPRLRELLDRCLEKSVRNRWHDIADVRLDVQHALTEPAGGPGPPSATVAPPTRSSSLRTVAALLVGALVGVVGWSLRPPASDPVVRMSHVLPVGQQFVAVTINPVMALSPDGSRVAWSAGGQLYVRRMDAFDASPVVGPEEGPVAPFFSPDGEWIGYWSLTDGQLKKISSNGGAPLMIAPSDSPRGTPSWQVDDTILVGGQAEGIVRVSVTDGTAELLIPGSGLSSPQMLPDGRSILFSERVGAEDFVVWQSLESDGDRRVLFPGAGPRYVSTGHLVYLLNGVLYAAPFDVDTYDVGAGVQMVEDVRTTPPQYAVSATGALAYVPGRDSDLRTLALVNRGGAVERLNVRPAQYLSPRLSPDGNQVAVQVVDEDGSSDVWVLDDLSGETQIRQLTTGEHTNVRPVWVDGGRLAYGSDRDGPMSIYLQAADGSGVAERLTTADDATEHRPESWSQAQRTLSYAVIQSDRSSGLWTMSLDAGSAPGLFYDDGVSAQRNSVFSPDGNWLAYTSTESGLFEVWVQPFPAVSGVKHRITQTGRSMAMWSPDGDELFYRPSPVGEATLLSIGLPNGPGSTFTGEQTLPVGEFVIAGDSRDYDITPDGERFLMVLRAQAESGTLYEPRIDFVLNWFEELEERVPVP